MSRLQARIVTAAAVLVLVFGLVYMGGSMYTGFSAGAKEAAFQKAIAECGREMSKPTVEFATAHAQAIQLCAITKLANK